MKALAATVIVVLILLVAVVGGAVAFAYSGTYNIGADAHHTRPVYALIEMLVDRSIDRRARNLTLPNLNNPQWILAGAGHYATNCTSCHLAPGLPESNLRRGLYPQPPVLRSFHPDPRYAFWVIKHGIKLSAMPAWGGSLDDTQIWNLVAFLEKMPSLNPAQYKELVARALANDVEIPRAALPPE